MLYDMLFLFALVASVSLCLYRIGVGPTPPDRSVAIDILGTVMVGFCVLSALKTGNDFFLDVALAWTLISFIGGLSLAKFLEGRRYDE
jgi:multicomponent Na+:H+ antiporter subunit F